ncbi:hypothetical protein IQ275_03980 [Nostoc sp. LEGE 12450]|nr:hypothetical protein [Nostoc sp. LEGE 12450]
MDIIQYGSVKVKTPYQSQFFNVDAERLAAGYCQGRKERKEKEEMLN